MKGFLAAERALNDTKAWIAGLSPEERSDPSCYAKAGTSVRTRFRSGVSAGCEPIVRPNWQYFNKALPRSVPQVVIVNGIERCFDKVPAPTAKSLKSGCPANRQLLETLDKQAVLDWLR